MFIDTYSNLIPVILIAMFILYEKNTAYLANTTLGKIIAVLLIIFYTSVDVLYGLLACALIVLYYQSDQLRRFRIYNENFSTINTSINDFKEQNCKNGIVMHKSSPVNLEMLEHIYPDINFRYEKCNPCSDTCDFSIIEEQIKAEESLKPQTSGDFSVDKFVNKISEFIPALWVKSEPFSSIE